MTGFRSHLTNNLTTCNPIEKNRWLAGEPKKKALYNIYYENFSAFKDGITNCLQKVNSDYKNVLKTTLTLNFHVTENQYFMAG
jgi:hypothetical protein